MDVYQFDTTSLPNDDDSTAEKLRLAIHAALRAAREQVYADSRWIHCSTTNAADAQAASRNAADTANAAAVEMWRLFYNLASENA